MIDPIISLAFSIHNNRGAYALLLGSGISRSAEIPTGWEVVQDLIRNVARVMGAECEPDPEAWYAAQFSEQPEYSRLLERVAHSPVERRQLLRSYFEPTADERESGKKAPTPAHRAIARLMADGYVRVVITTNFDRLLETALIDLGVQPTVVGGPDALEGMVPLSHAERLIVKVNGDYLDTRIRNTQAELDEYDPLLCGFLDRVFDEFGLIVSGWSAEWDTALRRCMERCKSHRFTTYWTTLFEPFGQARDLQAVRRASVIPIKDADSFFSALGEKIGALEDVEAQHPLSAKLAVAQAKRYLAQPTGVIRLHDLVVEETTRVCTEISSKRFSMDAECDHGAFENRLRDYEGCVETLVQLMACGAYWGEECHRLIWKACIDRTANCTAGIRGGINIWLDLRLYPATLLLYAAGVAAIAAERYGNVAPLLSLQVTDWTGSKTAPSVQKLNAEGVLEHTWVKAMPGRANQRTPESAYLHDALRLSFRDLIPDERSYTEAYDWFEYLLALCCWDRVGQWPLSGCFSWRNDGVILSRAADVTSVPRPLHLATQAGFFRGDAEGWRVAREGYNRCIQSGMWSRP